MKAFVTGGTGFIGSHLVEELKRRGYEEVRCLVRGELKWLEGLDVVPVRGDLGRIHVLAEACRDVDYVYHAAGVTRAPSWEAFEQGNIRATTNLLGVLATVEHRVRKVLVTSSLAAVGPSPGRPLTEKDPFRPISQYGRSKAEMELRAAEYADRVPLVIVRPAGVYGPREADIFTFFQTVNRGLCPIIGRGDAPQLSLVHVHDLVRGMVDAAESEKTTGETYFLGSDPYYSWNEIRAATLAALDRKALTVHVPPALVGAVGAVVETAGRLLGTYPPLNREKARELKETWLCSIEKAKHDFGFRQRIPLEAGLRETIAWYRQQGWLS